jgi:hypothetical protein
MNDLSPYSEVDPVIAKWVEAIGSPLTTEWADEPARFFYIGGDPPFECFQIYISPPKDGRIAIYAHAVDTNDDTEDELNNSWEGKVGELDSMISAAVANIELWKARIRKKPDPPSPWPSRVS